MNNTSSANQQLIEAEVFLGNSVRKIVVSRLIGQAIYWSHAPIVCRFRSGTKLHTKPWARVIERNGRFEIARAQVVANKNAIAVAWADDESATSNWSREAAYCA